VISLFNRDGFSCRVYEIQEDVIALYSFLLPLFPEPTEAQLQKKGTAKGAGQVLRSLLGHGPKFRVVGPILSHLMGLEKTQIKAEIKRLSGGNYRAEKTIAMFFLKDFSVSNLVKFS